MNPGASKLTDLVANFQSWIKNRTGIHGPFLHLWMLGSVTFSLACLFLSSGLAVLLAGLVFIVAQGLIQWWLYRQFSGGAAFGAKRFYLFKKLLNYFAFAQFCYHSIALVLAWSSSRLDDTAYYIAYALMALVVAAYVPVFLTLNSKRNQVERGIMQLIEHKGRQKYRPVNLFRGFFPGLLSWVDALVWASALVIFINSLVFQLYQIPTESMVPELYVGTRVFTVKTLTNPEIPLSLVRFPVCAGIKRFDQYVISNPRYTFPKEDKLRDFLSNFLYMISFTLIQNQKLDKYGEPIADPLIKRLIGLPGEQLMMVDDKVYYRTSLEEPFRLLQGDSDHAYTFAGNVQADTARIKRPTINPVVKKAILEWDRQKQSVEAELALQAPEMVRWFASLPAQWRNAGLDLSGLPVAALADTDFHFSTEQVYSEGILAAYLQAALVNPEEFSRRLGSFLTDWKAAGTPANAYEQSALGSNLLFKLKFIQALYAYTQNFAGGSPAASQEAIRELNAYTQTYVQYYFHWRNFPPYPEQRLLEPKEYFLMGDNRYNSIDFRHWDQYDVKELNLYDRDPWSLRYSSMQQLFSMPQDRIRGKALFSLF